MQRVALIIALVAALGSIALGPSVAGASQRPSDTRSSTLSGSELVASAVEGLSRIELGTSEATVTLAGDDGSPRSFTVDYGGLASEQDGPAADLRSLAILGVVGSVGLRFVGLLTRLGR